MNDEHRSERPEPGNETAYRERLAREAEFHDHSYSTNMRDEEVGKFYSIAKRSYDHFENLIFENVAGKSILEYGCGVNSYAPRMAARGAKVTGIDISPVAIAESQEAAQEAGVLDSIDYHVMNAEELNFSDNSFDLICGVGIIHHLDVEKAYSEIARVLRPGGRAVFHEPLGHNPLINRFRNRTPHLRTPDEHPLLMNDLERAEDFFSAVRVRYFHLASLGIVPFRKTPLFSPLYLLTEGFDRIMMAALPPLRQMAWMTVIVLEK